MADGVVRTAFEGDARPLIKTLSDVKAKVQAAFKGVDTKQLSASLKQVTSEIKQTEQLAQRAQMALDALMNKQITPKSVQALEKELTVAEKELSKMEQGYQKMLDEVEKYKAHAGLDPKVYPDSLKYDEAVAALKRYEKEFEIADLKVQQLHTSIDTLRQNPELTPEAKEYNRILSETGERLTELREKEAELGAEVQSNKTKQDLWANSAVQGFKKVEHRISRLAKRVLFFSLITMALRNFRKYIGALIQSDSELSASLAQVKGALAASFGMIWSAVLPAIRAMVNWLAIAIKYIAAFISWLTGKSFKQGQSAFESANKSSAGVAGNTKKIGKAAKKAAKEAQKLLLPFDQMNILSKDADSGAGGGAGGGGGAGIGGAGLEYPKEMDTVIAKFEKFKDLIFLIGAAFAGWKLAPIVASLLKISKIRAFVGVTLIVTGILLMIDAIRSIVKEGPNFVNVCNLIAGALLVVAGVLVLLGSPWALFVGAIAAVILIFRKAYETSAEFRSVVSKIGEVLTTVGTKIKGFFSGLGKQFKNSLKSIKESFSGSGVFFKVAKTSVKEFRKIGSYIMLGVLKGIWYVIKGIGKWIYKNVFKPIIKAIKKRFGISSPAKAMMDIGKQIILGVLEGMLQPFKNIGSWIKDNILTPLKEAFSSSEDDEDGAFSISTKFADTKETLAAKWDEITSGIKEKFTTIWTEVKEKVQGAIKALKEKWDSVKDKTATLIGEAKEKVSGAAASLKGAWDAVKDRTATLTGKLAGVGQSVLDKFKNSWNSISSKTATLSMNIKAAVGSAYNKAADKINKLIAKLPKAIRPSWRLPKLASGAVIPPNKEFLAVLGDQKRGTNIETPLSTMVEAFNQALRANGGAGASNVNVYLQGDAKQLFRVVRVEANNYTQATGKAAFNI